MSAALSVKIEEAMIARLDALAVRRGMTRDDVVRIALEEHIDLSEAPIIPLADWQLALIDEGLAAAERGDFASPEEVEAVFAKYRA